MNIKIQEQQEQDNKHRFIVLVNNGPETLNILDNIIAPNETVFIEHTQSTDYAIRRGIIGVNEPPWNVSAYTIGGGGNVGVDTKLPGGMEGFIIAPLENYKLPVRSVLIYIYLPAAPDEPVMIGGVARLSDTVESTIVPVEVDLQNNKIKSANTCTAVAQAMHKIEPIILKYIGNLLGAL